MTVWKNVVLDASGRPDYMLALLLFVGMTAGIVRGVGFLPRRTLWARLLSGWTCAIAITAAACVKLLN